MSQNIFITDKEREIIYTAIGAYLELILDYSNNINPNTEYLGEMYESGYRNNELDPMQTFEDIVLDSSNELRIRKIQLELLVPFSNYLAESEPDIINIEFENKPEYYIDDILEYSHVEGLLNKVMREYLGRLEHAYECITSNKYISEKEEIKELMTITEQILDKI